MINFYNYDVTKYCRCTTDDLFFEMLYGYNFEIIFIPKKDCADRYFEITFFLRLGQHNLLNIFYLSF